MTETKRSGNRFSESLRSVGGGSGAAELHSRADCLKFTVGQFGVKHVKVS
ncbi:MAG: hypothetical protein K2K57_06190 [Oscillospiraceae bacterium]|nr:hypothetical protein [Oscillospiraceae bacterium]